MSKYTLSNNYLQTYIGPLPDVKEYFPANNLNTTVLDAVGESLCAIFNVFIEGGGSKNFSSSGGKIYFLVGNPVTFDNASTTLKVGIQGLGATGLEDGVYQVFGEIVQASSSLPENTVKQVTMSSGGPISISHGDLIAVIVEMTVRGDSDSVAVGRINQTTSLRPYTTQDTGGGPTAFPNTPLCVIEFDDGTFGYTGGAILCFRNTETFNIDSTPDEYALIFEFPYTTYITEIEACLSINSSDSDYEIVLYKDPLGTPEIIHTEVIDSSISGGTTVVGTVTNILLVNKILIGPGTTYGLSIKPTSITQDDVHLKILEFEYPQLKRQTMLGLNWSLGIRSDETGAFTEVPSKIPAIGFFVEDLNTPGTDIHTFG